MHENNAEIETRGAWGTEVRGDQSPADPNSENGPSATGETSESVSVGILRAVGPGGDGAIIGGIVTRMIADKEERIREVRECIKWYQDEELKRLAELEDLQQLANQILDDDK